MSDNTYEEGAAMSNAVYQENFLNTIKFTGLMKACTEYMEFLEDDDYSADYLENYTHDIFEKAMKFCKGADIFDEVNRLIEEREAE